MGADERAAIIEVLDRYATALDRRDWRLLDEVFSPDATVDFSRDRATGRDAIVARLRFFLDGCGPTQHLLGNYRVDIRGDRATSECYVRAFHIGAGERAHLTYEVAIEYADRLHRTPAGWRIVERRFRTMWERGDPAALGSPR